MGAIRRSIGLACWLLALVLPACTPPIRQYALNDQPLTCEQANEYSYRTLQSMGFAIMEFEPAVAGREGTIRGGRDDRGGRQNVTVTVTCAPAGVDIDASEDRGFLGQIEFKRGFYFTFTGVAAQAAVAAAAAREEAQRPLAQKKEQGLRVLLEPVTGLGAKLDFDLDLAAGGVLPVRVTINNATPRTYALDPGGIVLIQRDGTRVPPLLVDDAIQRVAVAARSNSADGQAVPPDAVAIGPRLRQRLFEHHAVAANQLVKGYLFFPTGAYVKGRVTLEDQESQEAEGFVVEF